jgi:alcohol dehydrogenase class IV
MPRVLVADPDLVATTPVDVLAGSAMNGFDKAVETPYARTATPVTDATAVRALATLRDALPELRAAVDGADDAAGDGHGAPDGDPVGDAVEGVVLAQYGVSRPDGSTLSLVHAFGHALSRPYDLQQGVAHAVVAPATLEYLLEAGVARRDLLARGLGVRTAGRADRAVDRATVEAVAAVRDGLGLPARLRDVDGPEPGDFPAVADAVLADGFTPTTPLEPTREELVAVLERAW